MPLAHSPCVSVEADFEVVVAVADTDAVAAVAAVSVPQRAARVDVAKKLDVDVAAAPARLSTYNAQPLSSPLPRDAQDCIGQTFA